MNMRRRMYFILQDSQRTKAVHDELLLALIPETHMHVVANDDVDLTGLPEASLLQKSDLVHAIQLGIPIGGLTGILIGIVAIVAGWISPGFEAQLILATALTGLFMGTFASTLIAVNVPNTRHLAFEKDLKAGHLLLIVDVPVARVDEIKTMVSRHHPDVDMRGLEPNIPAFP